MSSFRAIDLGPRYRPLRLLGRGGMGMVFLVRDTYLKKDLALKIIHAAPATPEELEEVQREFVLLAQLEHPGIARAYDFGYSRGRPYFTSEFIPGRRPDEERLEETEGRSGTDRGIGDLPQILCEVADALRFLHRNEILHLDIKPSNIILRPEGFRPRAVLIDFGLCRRGLSSPPGPRLKGSLPYMGPEYFQGGPIGSWTDVYSFGVTAYRLATGLYPRKGAAAGRASRSLRPGGRRDPAAARWDPAPAPPSQVRPGLPAALDPIVLKCLAIDPRMRYQSGGEVLSALQAFVGGRARSFQAPSPTAPTVTAPTVTAPTVTAPTFMPPALTSARRRERTPRETERPVTVGRGAELERVDALLQDLLEKPGASSLPCLLLTALPGMGLSHLLREIKVRAQTLGIHAYLEAGFPGRSSAPGSYLRCLSAHMGPAGGEARSRWESFLDRLRQPRRTPHTDSSEGERRLRRASEVAFAAGAVGEPLLIEIDDLQFCDEISLGLIVDLIRFLAGKAAGERPPIGIVGSFREEGPAAPLLRELVDDLLVRSRGEIITLRPLGLEESASLYRSHETRRSRPCGSGPCGPAVEPGTEKPGKGLSALSVFQRTGGCPGAILALASGFGLGPPLGPGGRLDLPSDPGPSAMPPVGPAARSTARSPAHALPKPGKRAEGSRAGAATGFPSRAEAFSLLAILKLFARPACAAELSRLSGIPGPRVARLLRSLEGEGWTAAQSPSGTDEEWLPGPSSDRLRLEISPRERRRIHLRMGRELSRGKPDGPRIVEAVNHFRLAGAARELLRHAAPAARYLRSTLQSRAALDLLGVALRSIPPGNVLPRLDMALEMAELQAQVGNLDDGIRALQEFLPSLRDLPGPARLRTLLRLATLHGRRGDLERADGLFTEEMEEARAQDSGLSREEILFFLNEHAMVKAFKGDYSQALRLCDQGIELAGKGRSFATREMVLNLHATRANVALRTFDFASAAREFEKSLEIAEAIGSPVNQAAVLSNLGLVYSQSDRFAEAIRSYGEAERFCLRLDDGPSLVLIYGNLAVLHSKCGDFRAMERALGECERVSPGGGMGRRQELFLRHNTGLSLLNRGRLVDALAHLEAAIRLGQETGDRHVAAFDEVYHAEALFHLGRYAEALRKLKKLSEPDGMGRVRKMALARLALLGALTAMGETFREAAAMHRRLSAERPVPYLDAWDGLYLAWAFSVMGDAEEARLRLEPAEIFFRERGLGPGLSLARWVKAEGHFLRGDLDLARQALGASSAEASDLLEVLHPLLEARLALGGAERGGRARAADLLAQAGAALLSSPLPEWSARLWALRASCQEERGPAREEAQRLHRELAREIPEGARHRYLLSPHWRAWASPAGCDVARRSGASSFPAPGRGSKRAQGGSRTARTAGRAGTAGTAGTPRTASAARTVSLSPGPRSPLRGSLVTRSRAMQKLAQLLDRLKGTDLPVLIWGETGAGKELVARIIHRESQRSGGPFLVVAPAAIPAGLLEAELFGAKAGAFTDLREDRRGILSLASGGTVLIDGIAEVGLDVQAKLLRVLSESTLRPLGSEREESFDVRFLFATACDLSEEVRQGRFRRDLLHRIDAVTVRVPPLRDRVEDFPELVKALLLEAGSEPPPLEPGVIDRLAQRSWPGNVRELKNVLSRLALESPRRIDVEALDRVLGEPDTTTSAVFPRPVLDSDRLPALQRSLARDYMLHHFRRLWGSTAALCRFLGFSRRQLYRKMKRLGISIAKERARLAGQRGE